MHKFGEAHACLDKMRNPSPEVENVLKLLKAIMKNDFEANSHEDAPAEEANPSSMNSEVVKKESEPLTEREAVECLAKS